MKLTLMRTALHGETDEGQVVARLQEAHAISHPGYRSPEQLAALDQERERQIRDAKAQGRDQEAQILDGNPPPSAIYANHQPKPPERPTSADCHVIAVYACDEPVLARLEVETTDWDRAAELARADVLEVEI